VSTHSLPLPQSISRKADIDVSFHSPQTAGVIIKIEREMFRILDQSGTVRSLKPSQISSKVSTRFAVATDMEGFDIKAGETMKEANPVRSQFLRERSFLERLYTDSRPLVHRTTLLENDVVEFFTSTDPFTLSFTLETLSKTEEYSSPTLVTFNLPHLERTNRK